jgi:hypothetical protein
VNRSPVVAVVCTDGGQHAWTVLGDLGVYHGLLRANAGQVYGETANRRKAECVWLDDVRRPEYRVHVRCPRCRRHVQWRGERARDIVQRLAAAGVSQLDISRV